MRRSSSVVGVVVSACVLALPLVGCGNSTPIPPASAPASAYAPSTGAFVAVVASSSGDALAVNTCNLDAVNDKPAGSESLPHASTATFSGWAAGTQMDSVPASVRLLLKGARDYTVDAATGMPRPDVAKANKHPAWAAAGYSVQADLSAVAPGTYTPVLEFSLDGKRMQCATQHKLTIQ